MNVSDSQQIDAEEYFIFMRHSSSRAALSSFLRPFLHETSVVLPVTSAPAHNLSTVTAEDYAVIIKEGRKLCRVRPAEGDH